MQINFGGNQLSSSKYEELLGILLDNKLTFGNRLLNIVNKVNQKIHAFARISKHVSEEVENYHESICHFTVWILSTNLDVS